MRQDKPRVLFVDGRIIQTVNCYTSRSRKSLSFDRERIDETKMDNRDCRILRIKKIEQCNPLNSYSLYPNCLNSQSITYPVLRID